MKQILLFLTLFGISSLYGSSSDWRFHSFTFLGIEPTSWIKEDDVKGDVLNTRFSLGQELYISLSPAFSCGGGVRYLHPRGNKDGDEYTFLPVYLSLRLELPSEGIPFYLKGYTGYSLLLEEEGGLYYGLGAGTLIPLHYSERIRYSLDCGIAYSSCNGQKSIADEKIRIRYTSLDLSIGLGIAY